MTLLTLGNLIFWYFSAFLIIWGVIRGLYRSIKNKKFKLGDWWILIAGLVVRASGWVVWNTSCCWPDP